MQCSRQSTPLRKGVEPVETPAGGPEGGTGGPGGDGTSGPWWEGGLLGEGKGTDGVWCPVAPEGGVGEGSHGRGANPKIGAGFTSLPQKVERVDTAGDPV